MELISFILFIINFCLFCTCSEIDVKNYIIDGNVKVFHGTFTRHGRYKLFMGYRDPINRVVFGPQVIFPEVVESGVDYECLVELFERIGKVYLAVSIFTKNKSVKTFESRCYYKKVGDQVLKIEQSDFLSIISSSVFVNIDVSPGYKHPFIKKRASMSGRDKSVEYSVATEYNGMLFNTHDTVNYRFGYAHDPSASIVVGFKIFREFLQHFDTVTFHYRLGISEVIFKVGLKKIKYIKTKYIELPIWLAHVENEHYFTDRAKAEAYLVKDILAIRDVKFECIMLDLAEKMSPKLFGINKTIGKTNNWDYTLYEVNKEYKQLFKIKKIIDTDSDKVLIHKVNEEAKETIVETYTKGINIIIVITSFIQGETGEYTEKIIFERGINIWSKEYREMKGERADDMISELKLFEPIAIEIMIKDRETSVYSKELKTDENGFYEYYTINKPDGRAIESHRKYVFGAVKDKRMYEAGNVPTDKFGNTEVYLARHVEKQNIIFTNSSVPQEMDHMDIEKYEIIKC